MQGLKFKGLLLSALSAASFISTTQAFTSYQSYNKPNCGFFFSIGAFNSCPGDSFLDTIPYAISHPVLLSLPSGITPATTDSNSFYNRVQNRTGYQAEIGYDFASCYRGGNCSYGFTLGFQTLSGHHDTAVPQSIFLTDPDGIGIAGEPSPSYFTPFMSENAFTNLFILSFPTLDEGIFSDVSSNVSTHYTTVDLTGHVNKNICCASTQFFGGLRYLDFKQQSDVHASFTGGLAFNAILPFITTDLSESILIRNRFNGAGPRVGTNVFFPVFCGLGIFVEAAGELIYGSSRNTYDELFSFTAIDSTSEVFPFSFPTHDGEKNSRIVTGLSGKAALAYHVSLRNCSSFNLELGYQLDKYFSLVNHTGLVNSANLFENAYTPYKDSEFDIGGPYINVSWHY